MRRTIGVVLAVLVVFGIGMALWQAGPHVPEEAVLVLELGGQLEEAPPVDTLAQLTADGPALPTLLMLLDMAAADSRVDGVLVHIRSLQVGYARIQELRDALTRARAAGKKVVALLDLQGFNATREIYLASAADEVYAVPGGLAPFAGIAGQYLHMAGFFEKIGVEWEYARVGEFKSAVETFGARSMSEPAREMTNALIDGIFSQIVVGVSEGREIDPGKVRELVDFAPATADELVEAGLADGVAGREQVLEAAGLGEAEELEAGTYQRVGPNAVGLREGPRIALIFGDGAVVQAPGGAFASSFSADEVVAALKDATEDDTIEAIVLRINSGGGSALASEQIWRAVIAAREKKPVVASMADAAASGGYYVASAADAIYAEPATFTGSIGVFVMRPAIAGLYEKLDINSEVISRGRHAGITGSDEPLTTAQRERANQFVRSLYGDFIARVSESRGMAPDAVDDVGRGHVWLGSQALERGLVDGLGGLTAAVERARKEAGIADDVDPARVILPAPRSTFEQMRQAFRGEIRDYVARSFLPVDLPESLSWGFVAARHGVSYLPAHWVEIY